MQFTLHMLVTALSHNTTADGVFSSLEMQMKAQGKENPAQKLTRQQIVSDTNMALDFFLKARIIDRAVEETSKTREELETLLNDIENYLV